MDLKLIIAEKPDMMKKLKNAYEATAKYIRCFDNVGYYEGTKYVFACSLGHLFTFKMPNEIITDVKWDFEHLPLSLPDDLPLKVSSKIAQNYIKTLKHVIKEYEFKEIIVATDADIEGQLIYNRIKKMIIGETTIAETRLWIDEQTPEGFKKALLNRQPYQQGIDKGLSEAAYCRAYENYVSGMNGTMAMTAKHGAFGEVIRIGSVKTPVENFIYQREKSILGFRSNDYTSIAIQVESDEHNLPLILQHSTNKYLTANEAKFLESQISKNTEIKLQVKSTLESKRCKKLPNATDIAKEMNILYGFETQKTLDILQTLYQDKGLTTYPGTKAQQISASSAKNAFKPLENLIGLVSNSSKIIKIKENKWEINPGCVTTNGLAHEAITPVFGSINSNSIKTLTDDEKRVYEAVLKRYIQAFYPNARYEVTEVSSIIAGELFKTSGKILIDLGWQEIMGVPQVKSLPRITDGKEYPIEEIILTNKKTTPPPRYTEATLLDAMIHASRFIDDKHYSEILDSDEVQGLGTDRTRGNILKEIKQNGMFEIKGKTIYPTKKLMGLFEVMPQNTLIASPMMTAKMQEELEMVKDGKMLKQEYLDKVKNASADFIEKIKISSERIISTDDVSASSTYKCPICNAQMKNNMSLLECSCGLKIWKTIAKKKLNNKQLNELCNNKKTSLIKGFTSSKGTKFDARLVIDTNTRKVIFKFETLEDKAIGICPICGHPVIENDKGYSCSGWKEGCKMTIWKNISGKKISKKVAVQLLQNGKTSKLKGFISKAGNSFDAVLEMDKTTGKVNFKF